MRKYGKWLLVLGILAAYPAGVRADDAPTAISSAKYANQQKAAEVGRAIQKARINGYDLKVEVRGDAVKIDGKVRDVRHRDLAEKACRQVPGIKRVLNNLRYVPQGTIQQTAGRVDSAIRPAYHMTEDIGRGQIEQVHFQKPGKRSTRKKVVSNPTTRFYRQPTQQPPAQALNVPKLNYQTAAAVPPPSAPQIPEPQKAPEPVKTVALPPVAKPLVEKPVVQPPVVAKVSNNEVAQQIGAALGSMGLQNYDMEVRFADGKAILTGDVATLGERQAIGQRVSQVSHVQTVENQLQVKGPIAQASFGPPPQATYPSPMAAQAAPPAMMATAPPVAMGAAGNYSNPQLPNHAWPSYAQYPNSAAVQYPKQYSASAFPYIGPFYPYPQVPMGWRDVSLQWDDGFWQLNFNKKRDAWYWLFSPKNW